jgi:flavin-dependent dehydrogenase
MSTNSIVDPATGRSIPIFAHADVVVVGGGRGGVGSAIAAARTGAKTIIVERFGCFGGTWTSGLLSAIMEWPFVRGIFAEIGRRMNEAGGWIYWKKMDREQVENFEGGDPAKWNEEGIGRGAMYDAETAKYVLDQMIIEAGVHPLFFAQLVGVIREDDRVTAIIIESKEGRFAITGSWFIDSSGDGDLATMAGVPCEMGRESDGAMQPMSMIFKMSGVDDERAVAHFKESPDFAKEIKMAKAAGELSTPNEGVNTERSCRM